MNKIKCPFCEEKVSADVAQQCDFCGLEGCPKCICGDVEDEDIVDILCPECAFRYQSD